MKENTSTGGKLHFCVAFPCLVWLLQNKLSSEGSGWEENIRNYSNTIYYIVLKLYARTLELLELPWICNGALNFLMTIVFLSIFLFISNGFCFIHFSWNVICQRKVHDCCRFCGFVSFNQYKTTFFTAVHPLYLLLYSVSY